MTDWAEIVGRTLVVYVVVLAGLRLGGRRELGQLVEGVPVVLVQHGAWVEANLAKKHLTEEEVLGALREHGEVSEVTHVELAVLEVDGWVSVIPASARVHRSRRKVKNR